MMFLRPKYKPTDWPTKAISILTSNYCMVTQKSLWSVFQKEFHCHIVNGISWKRFVPNKSVSSVSSTHFQQSISVHESFFQSYTFRESVILGIDDNSNSFDFGIDGLIGVLLFIPFFFCSLVLLTFLLPLNDIVFEFGCGDKGMTPSSV